MMIVCSQMCLTLGLLCIFQIKKKLPKVNRVLAKRLLEDEEIEATKKETDTVDPRKPNKKKKGLTSEVLQDERFTSLFNNEVRDTVL